MLTIEAAELHQGLVSDQGFLTVMNPERRTHGPVQCLLLSSCGIRTICV